MSNFYINLLHLGMYFKSHSLQHLTQSVLNLESTKHSGLIARM